MAPGGLDRRQLSIGLLAAAFAPVSARAMASRALFDFAIAGGHYHGLARVAGGLAPGERLDLRPEPENPFDRFAVAVRHADTKLGYVPRAASERVSGLLAAGRRLAVEVVGPLDPRPDLRDLDDLVFTGFAQGDPRLRLVEEG